MQDTLQLFNYKVLTDSATGNEFYAIDRQELACAITVPSLKSANNGFTKGYLIGFGNGVLWTFLAIIVVNFILIRLKNKKIPEIKNDKYNRKERIMKTSDEKQWMSIAAVLTFFAVAIFCSIFFSSCSTTYPLAYAGENVGEKVMNNSKVVVINGYPYIQVDEALFGINGKRIK